MRGTITRRLRALLKPTRRSAGVIAVLAILIGLSACRTEKPADQPTVLGVPPDEAYLGVEYSYNFGAFGGDDLLDFSLTNAPPWLGLEATSNKARPGIIMRGVPGITGGARGDDDLGTVRNINVTTTDGGQVGAQQFEITVNPNLLSASGESIREGESAQDVEDAGEGERCEQPDLSGRGSHEVTFDTFNDDGTQSGTETRAYDTNPVLVTVELTEPSVQTSKIAFELRSDFDPDSCESDANAQECEFSNSNRDKAQIGKDVVLQGNQPASKDQLPQPDYVDVLDERSGVLTIPRGKTECYLRLELVDDDFPEPAESFEVAFTDVRQGLVHLGEDNEGVNHTVNITDNSPTVRFESVNGLETTALSQGATRQYRAFLTRNGGSVNDTFRVRLGKGEDSNAGGDDFEFRQCDADGTNCSAIDELVFSKSADAGPDENINRREFFIKATGAPGVTADDKNLIVAVDKGYQDGRPGYVRLGQSMTVWLNALTEPLTVAAGATDVAVADEGRSFVAGRSDSPAQGWLQVFDRFGNEESMLTVDAGGAVGDRVVVTQSQRDVTVDNDTEEVNEVAIAFQTDGTIAGASNQGNTDTVIALFRRNDGDEDYTFVWDVQVGTPGADDVRDIRIGSGGSVFIAGETTGTWGGESSSGGEDGYLQRIDSIEEDGGPEKAKVAWTRQYGTVGDDRVTALTLSGSTAHAVGASGQAGNRDFVFASDSGTNDGATVTRAGTARNDRAADATALNDRFWLAGTGPVYTVSRDESNTASLSASGENDRVYGLVFNQTGNVDSAIALDAAGEGSDESVGRPAPLQDDMVFAGVRGIGTGGESLWFSRVRRNLTSEEKNVDDDDELESVDIPSLESIWNVSHEQSGGMALGTGVEVLASDGYQASEITVLIERNDGNGGTEQRLMLFNGDGQPLNPGL
ncbi:hypothetical protein C8D92_10278 [Tamilnaduibacter salinus]|uniref:Uncharacterized protein n=1 Tax=Tamilnaduibacter salinus TaxID=1484056 RepID=A0A2A2I3K7_9GAMM|nr:hypothetical protein [Tamilnaduibacter salinus]PAV26299.1 hypothetical protein CF392_06780 [Tamilnaduibacter salinus]PVY78044.1 hypothetical protein C8D92_10278 [Tamilnaduibacter salinus]